MQRKLVYMLCIHHRRIQVDDSGDEADIMMAGDRSRPAVERDSDFNSARSSRADWGDRRTPMRMTVIPPRERQDLDRKVWIKHVPKSGLF